MLTLSSVCRTFWFVQECTYCCGLSACRHLCTLFQLQPECARRCSLAPITNVLLFPSCVQAKVLLPFLSDPLPFLSFYFLFLYVDNWSKSLEMMNKWMICYNGFPLGSFAQGNIYIARAPGRLNVMGGNAGYSGNLVLQVCSIVEKEMLASIFDFLELEIWLWKGWRMQLLLDQMFSEAWRTYFWLIVNRPMNFFCNVCNVMTAMALCTDEALCHGSYLFRVEFW